MTMGFAWDAHDLVEKCDLGFVQLIVFQRESYWVWEARSLSDALLGHGDARDKREAMMNAAQWYARLRALWDAGGSSILG